MAELYKYKLTINEKFLPEFQEEWDFVKRIVKQDCACYFLSEEDYSITFIADHCDMDHDLISFPDDDSKTYRKIVKEEKIDSGNPTK